ncbi:TMV resistance protein N-like [Pyrus ussuriensis x Pyrus communis]|uniref:TMV resistance protein N-like n=1 Tax=Pyrus ussuriensis x Pyrus communis TaxID=2448454 RepID=A0A5N5F3D4_9ROSA|nr:TMV resistance protein N-like [Pyrus ussuriensis x Pyrus communis]
MVVTPISQFNHSTKEWLHYVEDDSAPSSPTHEAIRQPPTTFREPIVHEIPIVSEVTSPRAS